MIYYVNTNLDADGDGVVNLGTANQKVYGVKTLYALGQVGDKWAYSTMKGETLPSDPQSLSKMAMAGPEGFMQGKTWSVGVNAWGGFGTKQPAPEGFLTDFDREGNPGTGLKRLGLYREEFDDLSLQGRAIEGFNLYVNGVQYANYALAGFSGIPGVNEAPNRWVGQVQGAKIEQDLTVGDTVKLQVKLTNTTQSPMTLRYLRGIDIDQSDKFNTSNKAVQGGVEVKFDGGTFFLRDVDGKATVATTLYNKLTTVGAKLTIGKVGSTTDTVVLLDFGSVTLQPGESQLINIEMNALPAV